VSEEVERLLDLVHEMLTVFGYPYTVELSTRPENSLGTAEVWERAERMLAEVLERRGQAFSIDEGGGAFYGPKLDFKLIDAIGRSWQGPTVQLDFNLPERFGLEYIGADNKPHRPVMLHRVLVGSMERFVGGLIEHYAGAFPLWLAPEQLRVIPITDEARDAARAVADRAKGAGIRVHLDDRAQTLNYRIAEAERLKTPYMAIIGKREVANGTVSLREHRLGREQRPQVIPVDELMSRLRTEIQSRALPEPAPSSEAQQQSAAD
jgi:threonyl-tRNA synthetase